MNKPVATITRTKQIMKDHHLSFKKSLGQNFLIDVNVLEKIVSKAGVDEDSVVIEIGPGIGALTEQLAKKAKRVYAFEIDQRLEKVLEETMQPYDNVEIIFEDILKVDLEKFFKENIDASERVQIVANLPYYITTAILMKLLMERLPIHSYTVMMQKEVAARMAASPNTKDYGSLSIAIQYYTKSSVLMTVPKTCFMPQPNVDSSILHLEQRAEPAVKTKNDDLFFELVKASFGQRRKTLKNNLQRAFSDRLSKEDLAEVFQGSGIEPSRRGESLTLEEFAQLADASEEIIRK
ncbi:16S rRNA (adenine(1518)-N(6)/adenine(1519)-N(6))-dimethyltransferase [Halalkalibacillus sediminis]|uniref:Ribosomal RNA small subunit methyltransferase A n=1 Tax=Halalkalibacillus sediminis TaxID=2018042 RepID=A0A2I0QT21_9BACI|nr:16S rRNA (adenine(1518)-N(6)/adenine(1519)-N(6))-dimethyltransferase RsmA [Halalkalibacillus sediminis]PKR77491.1 16S rRNA (adenine(1518)-N(6)/adenine(1519)-N(6))-dimethyltransferase [Halalkalibacillus sediminis]